MRVTVFSTFHNSSVKMNIKENQIVMLWGRKAIELAGYQRRRADKELCGVADCACGGTARAMASDAQGHEFVVLS